MTSIELIDWAICIALTIGIGGITIVGVMFLSCVVMMLSKFIMDALVDAKRSFDNLRGEWL